MGRGCSPFKSPPELFLDDYQLGSHGESQWFYRVNRTCLLGGHNVPNNLRENFFYAKSNPDIQLLECKIHLDFKNIT